MRRRSLLGLCFATAGLPMAAAAAELPPITSLPMALGQLALEGDRLPAALKNLGAACKGKYRRDLKDHPDLRKRLVEIVRSAATPAPARIAALDALRCFASSAFVPVVEAGLAAEDAEVVAHAAEVAARLDDPSVIGPLLVAFEKRRDRCKMPGLAPREIDACVWLTYAPGAPLPKADPAIKEKAAVLVLPMLESPYPKVREVAVETLASSGLVAYAAEIKKLIERESKKGGFESPNRPELLERFRARQKALDKAK